MNSRVQENEFTRENKGRLLQSYVYETNVQVRKNEIHVNAFYDGRLR
jgi:hypothetical protein